MNIKKIGLIFIVLLSLVKSENINYVDIPCSSYKKDFVKFEHLIGKRSGSNIETRVIFRNEKKILLKTITTIKNKRFNAEAKNIMISTLRENNGTIFILEKEIDNKGRKLKTKNIPGNPICGKVPEYYTFESVNDTPFGRNPKMKYTVKIKKIGKKKIKIEAGEFKTEVIQKTTSIEMVGMKNAALTKIVSVQYYTKDIGLIKQDMTTATIMPKIPGKESLRLPKTLKSNFKIELSFYKNK